MAALGVPPWGKLKLLGKIGEGVEALKNARGARRAVECLVVAGASRASRSLASGSEECKKWVDDILDHLPEWKEKGKTIGELLDDEGNPIPDLPPGIEQMKSGEKWPDGVGNSYADLLWAEAQKRLYGKPGFPTGKNPLYKASSHVETKYAVWMDQNNIESATVVINNNAGVCSKAQNCSDAVGYILPAGSKLTVYFPGGMAVLWGKRP
ncbi:DddA-like double-stranded DNA deaminase toxin [Streptomyces sp. SAS_281]|uniref:DddA-like double-stranded DNA deaminase toxin n=1 Tax=Streptomyces sp. SAS_281 TaxID=3412744 RepID=UPI00403D3AC3